MATSVKKTIPVLDMSCAACAASVESILRSQTGVVDASVNFATANVTLEYVPGVVEIPDLKKAVQSIGYDLLIDTGPKETDTLESIHQKKYCLTSQIWTNSEVFIRT